MGEVQHEAAGEITLGYRSILIIAFVGIAFVVVSAFLGKPDLRTELPYDLGIACLIIAAIEYGFVRGLKRISVAAGQVKEFADAIRPLYPFDR